MSGPHNKDELFMEMALELAELAASRGEVPIGAIVVKGGAVVGRGLNSREKAQVITGHAEIQAIQDACSTLSSWRLDDCTLYVTLEPCMMCAGAIQQARLARLVYGAADPKAGAVGSKWSLLEEPGLNHYVEVESGVLQDRCSTVIKDFFRELRAKDKATEKEVGGRGARRRTAKEGGPLC